MTASTNDTGAAPRRAPKVEPVDLIDRARAGHRDACDLLAQRYRQPAFHLALQLLGNREDALDVAQDAMVRFFTHLDRFDSSRPVLPWLRQIVRNRARDLMRHGRVRVADSLDSDGPEGGTIEIRDAGQDPESLTAQRLLRQTLWQALHNLDPAHREILVLRDYQDLSYREIAELIQIPLGTVMSRLHAARQRLRKVLVESGAFAPATTTSRGLGR